MTFTKETDPEIEHDSFGKQNATDERLDKIVTKNNKIPRGNDPDQEQRQERNKDY